MQINIPSIFKIDSSIGSIKLIKEDRQFRLIHKGDTLEEDDIIELLSPINQVKIKTPQGIKEFSGVCKIQLKDSQLINISEMKIDNILETDIIKKEQENYFQEIDFSIKEFLKQNMSSFDMEHILEHNVWLFDIPNEIKIYKDNTFISSDEGCLILNVEDKLKIEKSKPDVSFIVSAYIFHQTKISQFTSYPKKYKPISKLDENTIEIKREETLEFIAKI